MVSNRGETLWGLVRIIFRLVHQGTAVQWPHGYSAQLWIQKSAFKHWPGSLCILCS